MFHRTICISLVLTSQKYIYNQEETLNDRYNTSKHCPFYHKDVPNGFNIYLAEQYINPASPSANIYYWLRIHKHPITNLSFNKDRSAHKLYLLLLSGIEPNPGPRRPRLKRCSVRLYLQLFVWGRISYLRYLCINWCQTHIVLCFSSSCVPSVASFPSGLSFLIDPFGIL